jgi:glycosyltransferase involved in cell wall biosynthesis
MTEQVAPPCYDVLMLAPTMFFADYGCHVRILEEALTLRRLGHRVTIMAYPNGRDVYGLDVRRCRGVPFNYRVIVGSSRHKLYLDGMLAVKAAAHVMHRKPDVIHAHLHEGGLLGWLLSALSGVPMVLDFQGSLTGEMLDHHFLAGTDSWAYRPLRWLETRIDRAAPVVLTSSHHAAVLLRNEFGVAERRIYAMPDCVDAEVFTPGVCSDADKASLKRRLGIPAGRRVIVYLGLLTEYQGIGLLLDAVRQLRLRRVDFHLLLMGFPEQPYQVRAAQLGVADLVTFTGKVSYEEAASYLALGDLAVAPKISATEGSGKILNYMSMALPTVAFDLPVSREYLGDGGMYASASTPAALADALERVLAMPPDQRARLGGRLRERAATLFSWGRVGEQLTAIYQALVEGQPLPYPRARQSVSARH